MASNTPRSQPEAIDPQRHYTPMVKVKTDCSLVFQDCTRMSAASNAETAVNNINGTKSNCLLTPKQNAELIHLMGGKCMVWCCISGVEVKVLWDTG